MRRITFYLPTAFVGSTFADSGVAQVQPNASSRNPTRLPLTLKRGRHPLPRLSLDPHHPSPLPRYSTVLECDVSEERPPSAYIPAPRSRNLFTSLHPSPSPSLFYWSYLPSKLQFVTFGGASGKICGDTGSEERLFFSPFHFSGGVADKGLVLVVLHHSCLLFSRSCPGLLSQDIPGEGSGPKFKKHKLIIGFNNMASKCFFFRGNKNHLYKRQVVGDGLGHGRMFTYKELRKATDDFSPLNRIGQGGFGTVYKAKLKDGTIAAVKVLSSESKQGLQEFLNEINAISNIVHENLVRLIGCCIEKDERILVYNYLENRCLSQTLLGGGFRSIRFSWQMRTQICLGVARGLAYLHEIIRPHIVHRDIKASNILLDKDLNPKIADFGLAKLLPADATHVSTRVAGTVGYLAPEYAITGQLTRRADIYSFGVLLLEIISGRCNTDARLPSEDRFILEKTWQLYERNDLLSMVDPSLEGEFDADEATRFLKVGLLCTQDEPKLRPTMSRVIKYLTGEQEVEGKVINKPGLITNLTDLKIKKPVRDWSSTKSGSSRGENSSFENTQASFSFPEVSDSDVGKTTTFLAPTP